MEELFNKEESMFSMLGNLYPVPIPFKVGEKVRFENLCLGEFSEDLIIEEIKEGREGYFKFKDKEDKAYYKNFSDLVNLVKNSKN